MSVGRNKTTPHAVGKYLKYPTKFGDAWEAIGGEGWFKWLEGKDNTTIYVDGYPYSYTARREKRRNKFYWYAFMKLNGTLYKVYMGQSDRLTHEHIFHTIPQKLDDKYYGKE